MKKKRRRLLDLLMLLVLIAGLAALSYPLISNQLNDFLDQQLISYYQKKANKDNQKDLDKLSDEMAKKNAELAKAKSQVGEDPFTDSAKAKKKEKSYYQQHTIGILRVPSIKVELPIFDEASETLLTKGAGVVAGTSYPIGGQSTHTVLAGHRGLSSAALFTDLPKVKLGDVFYIEINNETHAYKVDQIKTVLPDDTDDIQVVQGKDYATLMTCTPYMVNSHRLLVRGHRIPYDPKQAAKDKKAANRYKMLSLIGLIAAGLLILLGVAMLLRKWWLAGLIAERHYQMKLKLVDGDNQPLPGIKATVLTRNKRRLVKRKQEPITGVTDENGILDLGKLLGNVYQLQLKNTKGQEEYLKTFVPKMKSTYFFYKKNNRFTILKQSEEEFPVVLKKNPGQ